jgi:outer membrane protein assembly factor BamB
VNSESPLEQPPAVQAGSTELPACIAANGRLITGNDDFGACAATDDGIVIARVRDEYSSPWFRTIRAFDPSGTVLWATRIDAYELSAPAVDADDTSYVGVRPTSGGDSGALISLDRSGQMRWSVPLEPFFGLDAPAPIIDNAGHVFVVHALGNRSESPRRLSSFDADGQLRWQTEHIGIGPRMVLGEDGRVFVQYGDGVIAYSPGGDLLWMFVPRNREPFGGMTVAADGTLYVASRFLYAVNRDGSVKWTFKSERTYTDGDQFARAPLIGDDGTVYILSFYQQLYAINADGRKKWQVHGDPRRGPEFGGLFLTLDGRLLTEHGYLIVGAGLASHGWPSADGGQGRARALGGQ